MDIAWTQWKPADLTSAMEDALTHKRAALAAIKAVPASDRSFANTIAAHERSGDSLSDLQQRLSLLMAVHPEATIRDAAQVAGERIERENIAMEFDRDLWRATKEWSGIGESLDPIDRKLADDTLRDMRRMGFDLPDDRFERLKTVRQELQKLENEFEQTINGYEDHIVVTAEQLSGMPDRYIKGLARDGEGYRISLQYPELFPFMQYAHDETARKELSQKHYRKGGWDNMLRLARMIELRQEHAVLLGYATHADYVTETRMAKNGTTVEKFLGNIITKLVPAAQQELRDLVDIKKRVRGLEHPAPMYFFETAYWANRLLKERYDLNSEEVREYLPTDHVMTGIMELYQSLLGLRFEALPDAVLWHPDVKLTAVFDASSNQLLGHFALDLYPRAGKYGHAAAFPVTLGRTSLDGTEVTGMVALVCNFPKPLPDTPSLLSHDELETLLHEFGHVMHALVSGGRWQQQNGFNVPMDFIEALSQIFEYWAWSPQVLERMSRHYQTGKPLPAELITKIISAKRHMEPTMYLKQAVQSLYDLHMHSRPATGSAATAEELAQLHRTMYLDFQRVPLPSDAIFAAGWGHMADYDAGYYGYLWSKVYAADMFTVFAPDPFSTTVGHQYREKILNPGSSKSETSMVQEFLGRPSNSDAFLTELGIR